MPTPIQWLAPTQTNTGTAANEGQSDPQIIGLSNGNFLVAWVESGTTGVGTTNGTDIIGKIFDAEGNLVRDSFRINTNRNADDEGDFSIAATNDGGFVMVYNDDDITVINQTEMIWERFDASGNQTNFASIAIENVAADFLANPQVSVNLLTNESYVSFTQDVGVDTDINGVIVSATGVVGSVIPMAQNGPDFDGEGDIAVLTGGNFVSVYLEDDLGTPNVEFVIRDAAGVLVSNQNVGTGTANDAMVAALSDGNWVVAWEEGSNINYRVYGPTGSSVTGILTAAGTADFENEPSIIGLPQGGFAIVWDNDSTGALQVQMFTNAGATDGAVTSVGNGTTSPTVGVTADGRLLFTWIDQNTGEVFHSVMDSRGATINATDYDNSSRSFVSNTGPVTGNTLSNTINDTFTSDGIMLGGDGGDTFVSGDGINGDTYNGGNGTDTLNFSSTNFISTVNINLGTGVGDVGGGGNLETYISIENYIGGSGSETIIGSNSSNVLTGGAGNNTINGLDGGDTINGGGGNDIITAGAGDDSVNGGDGDDMIIFTAGDWYDYVVGGAGIDTIDGSAGTYTMTMDFLAGTLVGDGITKTISGIEFFIATNLNDTIYSNSLVNIDAGGGNDTVFAGLGGAETLNGGAGIDLLNTTSWGGDYVIDLVTGVTNYAGESFTNFENVTTGDGNDTLTGTGDANIFNTGAGNDTVNAGGGNDTVNGGGGADTLNGENGNDILSGGLGNDILTGGTGLDQMFGGDGDDIIFSDTPGDLIDGGAGVDRADFSTALGGAGELYWTLADGFRGFVSFTGAVTLQFVSIENFVGLNISDDNVLGTSGANSISGLSGDDWLRGVGGNDVLNGGDGADLIDGGLGIDAMTGGLGDDVYYVDNAGDSTIEGVGEGIDEVRTTVNNYTLGANLDNLRLQAGAVVGTGNALANTIIAGVGPATLNGLGGDDIIFGSGAGDTIDGGANNDSLYGRNGNDNIQGGAGNDLIRGEVGSDTLNGGLGNDQIFGDEGIDTLFGGDGDDDLRGGIQNDTLWGEAGADTLRGDDGNDNLYGGAARDFFTGGAGNDNFYFDDGDFSGITAATADRITDFVQGADRIRLNLVDAIAGGADNAFTFIGTGAFTSVAGQLRYQVTGGTTMVYGDTNGDGVADFAIGLTGAVNLVAADFAL